MDGAFLPVLDFSVFARAGWPAGPKPIPSRFQNLEPITIPKMPDSPFAGD